MFYGRKIHDNCPRRTHFDGGRFVEQFGSKEEAEGYCLYKVGCKGPEAWAECPKTRWNSRSRGASRSARRASGAPRTTGRTTSPRFIGKLADVALPYGDVTADNIGIGLAVATGAAIAGHAVLKAAKGKGEDGKKK